MKERPILMTPENAQKCFDGVKSQTRRIVKDINPTFLQGNPTGQQIHNAMRCPYGEVGDRLWIRESFCITSADEGTQGLLYRGQCEEYPSLKKIWKPSLHMPRWACRTVVQITEIRVQRVQDISDDDKIAEGMDPNTCLRGRTDQWIMLWNSINGDDSWDENPWVWCISFKKVAS